MTSSQKLAPKRKLIFILDKERDKSKKTKVQNKKENEGSLK